MKRLLLIFLCVAFAGVVKAQDIRFGLTGGPAATWVQYSYTPFSDPKSVAGIHFGFFSEFPLSDQLSLRPELKVVTYGSLLPSTETVHGIKFRSAYATLPLLAQYAVTDKLKIGIGPYVSTNLLAQEKVVEAETGSPMFDEDDLTYSSFDLERKIDAGITGGVSYQVLPRLGINLRYNHGMASSIDDGGGPDKHFNRSLSLGIDFFIK